MRTIKILALGAVAALGLAGCTTAQEQQAVTGVNVACTALGVGSQIAVTVASQGRAQTISQAVGEGVSSACPLLVSGVTAAVNQITAEGQTATVDVVTTSPKGARRSARFRAVKQDGAMHYVVPPDALGFLGL